MASADFLAACGKDYAGPKDATGKINRLGAYFAGKYLDQITRGDVEAFMRARLDHKGPFAKYKRATGLRGPIAEVVELSQVYRWLQDQEFKLGNPCLRPANVGRARKSKAWTYTPKRQPVIPSTAALAAIFTAPPSRMRPEHQAFFRLAYCTGGRPESDLLRLTHNDVDLVDGGKVRSVDGKPVLGSVHFRDPKTPAGNRTIPLHAEAASALAKMMLPEPTDAAERERWESMPIFRTHNDDGKARPWDRHTYRKAWANVLKVAVAEYPEVRGMVVRDLRKVFRTRLTDARTPEPTIRCLMGHTVDVSQGYYDLSREQAVEAILSLPVPAPGAPLKVAVQVAV
jgi:hypothetical protein